MSIPAVRIFEKGYDKDAASAPEKAPEAETPEQEAVSMEAAEPAAFPEEMLQEPVAEDTKTDMASEEKGAVDLSLGTEESAGKSETDGGEINAGNEPADETEEVP